MKTSVYTKSGERAATSYYRIYQYIREIPGIYRWRKMLPDRMYHRVMPISDKNIIVKCLIMIYIVLRVFGQLVMDFIDRPDVLIISRRFVNRILPYPYIWILNSLKKRGTKIIWDFDDEILQSKEVSKKGFAYMSELADYIVVASPFNKEMIEDKYRSKVQLLPTTDGDMYKVFDSEVLSKRLKSYDKEIRIIWVGTSVSLQYVKEICPALDEFAQIMSSKYSKKVILTVVSNRQLVIDNLKSLEMVNIEWERDIAIAEMLRSHVGIMPLLETSFTKGKGGFKLIQYLSVGLPVIGSPVGINNSIITEDVGVAVSLTDFTKWTQALEKICDTPNHWRIYANNAYQKWLKEFNYENNLEVWQSILSC